MSGKRQPKGCESAVAHATLATLNERETREREIASAAALSLAPVSAMWRDTRRGAIRLIDLERRARFARLGLEPNRAGG